MLIRVGRSVHKELDIYSTLDQSKYQHNYDKMNPSLINKKFATKF